jgi:hypothetical protein
LEKLAESLFRSVFRRRCSRGIRAAATWRPGGNRSAFRQDDPSGDVLRYGQQRCLVRALVASRGTAAEWPHAAASILIPFKEASMSDSVSGGAQDSIGSAAQRVAGGVQHAADQIQHAVCKTHSGVGEVRDAIRAQPITAALVVFALGYLFGRLGALIPSRH